jgi:ABC-type nickel/cobalt efflux system permease component RcnA
MINLWAPQATSLGLVLLTAFLLGIVHGVTPDEHTWPITFSYAVGGYSTRRGLRAGLLFSLAFTIQRALASELAYLGLAPLFVGDPSLGYVVYIVVGCVMAWAG